MSKNSGNQSGLLSTSLATLSILAAGAAFFFGYSLKIQNAQLAEDFRTLKSKSESLAGTLTTTQDVLKRLESHSTSQVNVIAGLSADFQRLSASVKPMELHVAETIAAIQSVQAQVAKLAPRYEGVSSDLAGVNQLIDSTRSVVEDLKNQNQSILGKQTLLAGEQNALAQSLNRLTGMVETFQTGAESISKKLNLLESTQEESLSKLLNLQSLVSQPALSVPGVSTPGLLLPKVSEPEKPGDVVSQLKEAISEKMSAQKLIQNAEHSTKDASAKDNSQVESTGDKTASPFAESVKSITGAIGSTEKDN